MRRSFLVIGCLISFLTGVMLHPSFHFSLWGLGIFIFIATVFILVFRSKKCIFIFCIFSIFVAFGLIRGALTSIDFNDSDISFYNDELVRFSGVITEVDIRRDQAKYKIKSLNLFNESGQIEVQGQVLINLNKHPSFEYGDLVEVVGELKAPEDFDGFSYSNYLSRYGIYSVMYRPKVFLKKKNQGNFFWHLMSRAQNIFMQQINRIFPEPYASFEAGLLVGARKGIHPDLMEKFNITGLTHIIAISGYNITLIIIFVMAALKGLPRRIAFVVAIISIILFTLFVGASPAVVRASIMGILGLMALQFGRQNNIHITILFSAFFMVMWNPKILWWDIGFQLSFMAVMGLIYVAPVLEKYVKKLPESFGVKESIQMTLAAQIMALPVIVFNFERLSMIAPIANLFVAFALPFAMLFGFIAVLLSFVLYELSLIFAYLTSIILDYIILVIEWMAKMPYASIDIVGMRLWMVIGYYVLLGVFLAYCNRKQNSEVRNKD